MKKEDFLKMLKKFPKNTEIMLVQDWEYLDEDGHPLLCSANDCAVKYKQPQGWDDDDGCIYAYLFNNPDKE